MPKTTATNGTAATVTEVASTKAIGMLSATIKDAIQGNEASLQAIADLNKKTKLLSKKSTELQKAILKALKLGEEVSLLMVEVNGNIVDV